MGIRNPPWSRDELIVTLDFYLRYSPHIPSKKSDEITALSNLLNQLQNRLGGVVPDKFRNVNGVYMKLMNFRRFDPEYTGVGLQRGNKDEEVVWNLFASQPGKLKQTAEAIRNLVSSESFISSEDIADDEEGEEGRILTRTHRYRERNAKIVGQKKKHFLKENGSLFCEVCGFDFANVYGQHGDGFIECHHTKPVSGLTAGERTKMSELAVVCSNCHRMIHRKRPWLSLESLKVLLGKS